MSLVKTIVLGGSALFLVIGSVALFKKKDQAKPVVQKQQEVVAAAPISPQPALPPPEQKVLALPKKALAQQEGFPDVDRIEQLFKVGAAQLPIMETITYSHTVPWLKGRPAWLSDYASHFTTSRHFIARSLNKKPDYLNQKVSPGCKFNVFRKDKQIQFYLLVDAALCKMGLYYVDLKTGERVLLKTYSVGLGKKDESKPSGCLTPLGRYPLGNKIAVYKPGILGNFHDKKVEMVQVFGTRWIPFENLKGYGLQGAPWTLDPKTGEYKEETIGTYDSDGCIRLAAQDIEEIFSIVITKPTFIEVVKDFKTAKLPGVEVFYP